MNPYYKRLRSFIFAWRGLLLLWQDFNMRLHVFFGFCVVLAAWLLGVSLQEWLWLLAAIGAVLVCEGFNTALEKVVDLASPQQHPLAAQAKDIAAGTVLLASGFAALVGLVVFLPKVMALVF